MPEPQALAAPGHATTPIIVKDNTWVWSIVWLSLEPHHRLAVFVHLDGGFPAAFRRAIGIDWRRWPPMM